MGKTPKGKGDKGGRGGKKKYAPPKLVRHGNLETVAARITGAVALACCVSERLKASRTSAKARAGLIGELSAAVAARR
jgi:hypothetical protein